MQYKSKDINQHIDKQLHKNSISNIWYIYKRAESTNFRAKDTYTYIVHSRNDIKFNSQFNSTM